MTGKTKQRRQTPESRFYDTLKGKEVRITLSRTGLEATGVLLWVDRYSLGLRYGRGREVLLNKRSVEAIELNTPKREQYNGERDYGGATV